MRIKVEAVSLREVLLIKPRKFDDQRGYFLETFRRDSYKECGVDQEFVQENASFSHQNVLRGLHFQWPNPQAKLVSVLHGKIFDIAVDIRFDSPSFGEWFGVELSAENGWQLYIPEGFAHGFCALSEGAVLNYKCSRYYSPNDEKTLLWNDPAIGIQWPVSKPQLSSKDLSGLLLSQFNNQDLPGYHGK